ncbi:hypothetical protein [Dactylosporangium sp. CA-233914]|uniref:hypothetical protein n=1 Tax=Dactylosporangium sp. CA-233914 TaxID=3239934 RepID=UPI003D8C5647
MVAARLGRRRIVVFDELSSGVDRRHLESISRIMHRLAGEGAVVVLISHDADLLAAAATHELRLRRLEPR